MSVKSHELENREQGPAPRGTAKVQAEVVVMKAKAPEEGGEPVARLRADVAAGIATARGLRPGPEVVDGASFGAGRDAAIAAIEAAVKQAQAIDEAVGIP